MRAMAIRHPAAWAPEAPESRPYDAPERAFSGTLRLADLPAPADGGIVDRQPAQGQAVAPQTASLEALAPMSSR